MPVLWERTKLMAHDAAKLGRHIEALWLRHAALEARISTLDARGPLLLPREQDELKRTKMSKSWLKLRLSAAEALIMKASARDLCSDPVALAVATEVLERGAGEMQVAA